MRQKRTFFEFVNLCARLFSWALTLNIYYDGDNTDKIICYAGAGFTYDSIGNPTTYRGRTATWENGRQFVSYDGNAYTYDARGRRISKRKGNNTAVNFTYDTNGNLISQSNGMEFLYDHTGVFAVIFNGATYFYSKNAQRDIILYWFFVDSG